MKVSIELEAEQVDAIVLQAYAVRIFKIKLTNLITKIKLFLAAANNSGLSQAICASGMVISRNGHTVSFWSAVKMSFYILSKSWLAF